MSALHAIYLLSTAGALLFFFGGYLVRGLRGAPPGGESERREGEHEAKLAEVVAGNGDLTRQLAERSRVLEERGRTLEQQRRALEELRAANGQLSTERDEFAREGERLRRDAVSGGSAKVASLERELTSARAMLASDAQERARLDEVRVALDGETRRLKTALDVAEKKLASDLAVETARKTVDATKARKLNEELAASRAEIDGLREALRQKVAAATEVEAKGDEQARAAEQEALEGTRQRTLLASQLEAARSRLQIAEEIAATTERLRDELREAREREAEAQRKVTQLSRASAELHDVKSALAQAEQRATRFERLYEEQRGLAEQRAQDADASGKLAGALAELRDARLAQQRAQDRVAQLERAREEQESTLREELAKADDARAQAVRTVQAEVRDMRVALASAEARGVQTDRLRDENRVLNEHVAELRTAATELTAAQQELKQSRLDAAVYKRRIEELERGRVDQGTLERRVRELTGEVSELGALRERARLLEAKLYAVGHTDDVTPSRKVELSDAAVMPSSMETALARLVEPSAMRSAVVADRDGLLVAGAGDQSPQEGLAALSGITGNIVQRVQELLPIATVEQLSVRDSNELVVWCRFLECEGEHFTVATIGSDAPATEEVAAVIPILSRAIAGTPIDPE
jgi:hypothetical protein